MEQDTADMETYLAERLGIERGADGQLVMGDIEFSGYFLQDGIAVTFGGQESINLLDDFGNIGGAFLQAVDYQIRYGALYEAIPYEMDSTHQIGAEISTGW